MKKIETIKKRGRLKKTVQKDLPNLPAGKQGETGKLKKESKPAKSQVKAKPDKYFEGLGRRKTVIARVRIFPQKQGNLLGKNEGKEEGSDFVRFSTLASPGSSVVNEKPLEKYFPAKELQQTVLAPLNLMNCLDNFKLSVRVKGGGLVSQAEAIRHGLARALVLFNADFRKKLKKAGFLKRDPRMRERKKFGLKRARKAPQWQKR